jgi:hypothetical protein
MRKKAHVLFIATLSLASCAGVEVSEDKSNKGIPFYVKVPVATQETVLGEGEIVLSFVVSKIAQVGESTKVLHSTTLPFSGPLRIPERKREELELALNSRLTDKPNPVYEDTVRDLGSLLRTQIARLARPQTNQQPCATVSTSTISNSWSVTMVADTMPRYVVTKIPFMGSATSSFKFAPDGTMTESSMAVADDTAKTLLALLPIKEKLTKQWDVHETEAEATSPGTLMLAQRALPQILGAKPMLPSISVRLETLISYSKVLYTLRKVHHFAEGASLDTYLQLKGQTSPLTLCQAMSGADGVQLVSVVPQGSESGKPEKSSAWQIQGTATPPKADDLATQR